MILKVFSVFDTKLAAYNVPFFARTESDAIRSFTDLCVDPRSRVYQHREDYALYRLGSFDDDIGELHSYGPQCLVTASAVMLEAAARTAQETGTSGAAAGKADAAAGRKAEEE